MDVVKVFTEEPIGLEALVSDTDPDARRRSVEPAPSLEETPRRGSPASEGSSSKKRRKNKNSNPYLPKHPKTWVQVETILVSVP